MTRHLDMAAHDDGTTVEHITVTVQSGRWSWLALAAGFLLGIAVMLIVR